MFMVGSATVKKIPNRINHFLESYGKDYFSESIFHDKTVSYVNVEGLLNEFGGLHCCTLNLMY